MQHTAVSAQDSLVISVLAVAIALGLTLTTPAIGMQAVVGFLIVLTAFTSVSAALYLLIASMLLSPEIAVGRVEGRGVGGRELSFRMDDILLVIIGASWLVKNIIYRELALFRETPLNRPIAVYMVICVVSTLLGILNGHVRPMTGFFFVLKYFEYFFVFFMVVNHVRSQEQVVGLVSALLVVGLIVSLYAIYQIPSGQRASAPFEGESGEPNTLGGYLVFLLAIMTGLLLHIQIGPIRIALLVLSGFAILALMATLSRSSYLAGAVLLMAVGLTQWRRPRVVTLLLVIMMLIPLLAPANVKQRVNETFFGRQYGGEIKVGKVGLDLSTTERLKSWAYVLKDWVHDPILGRGITGYAWADAQYVKILGETGLAGLVAFGFIIYRLWRCARESFLSQTDPFAKGLAHGLLLGLLALLAHGIGANTFIIIRIMEPFWLCAGLVMLLPTLSAQIESPVRPQEAV
ncbi:MAG: O-antigen ligase family protein [Nitrospira sp.]|jgi:O-antigen ligase|nr:O-antigen ligase family protein [Nitrospira sp. BO4]